MVDQEKEIPLDDAQEVEKAKKKKPKPKPKPKAQPKTKTAAKAKSKAAAKTKATAKPKTATAKPADEPAAAEANETIKAAQPPLGSGDNKKLLIFGGGVAALGALLIVILAVVLAFNFGIFGGGGKNILIGFPDNDWNVDVYLLQPGDDEDDGVRIAKDVEYGGASFYIVQDGKLVKSFDGFGFVPDTSQVLISYSDEGETFIEQMQVKDEESSDLFDTEDYVHVLVFGDQKKSFYLNTRMMVCAVTWLTLVKRRIG